MGTIKATASLSGSMERGGTATVAEARAACAKICRSALADGDGKPCIDCGDDADHWDPELVAHTLWLASGVDALSTAPTAPSGEGPVPNPEGERLYRESLARSLATLNPEDRKPASLEDQIRFIERWMPEAMPATDQGQISFGRSLLESALDTMKAALTQAPAGQAPAGEVFDLNWPAFDAALGIESAPAQPAVRPVGDEALRRVAEAINKARYYDEDAVVRGLPYRTLDESGPTDRAYCTKLARAALVQSKPDTGQAGDGRAVANVMEALWRDAEDEVARLASGFWPSDAAIAEAFHEHRRGTQPSLPPWSEVTEGSGIWRHSHNFATRLSSLRPTPATTAQTRGPAEREDGR